jgi:hypothetical protein
MKLCQLHQVLYFCIGTLPMWIGENFHWFADVSFADFGRFGRPT